MRPRFGRRRSDVPGLKDSEGLKGGAMLSDEQAGFVLSRRVGRLATADAEGQPHVVPVCFAVADGSLYVSIDEKPKQASSRPLKRLRNCRTIPRSPSSPTATPRTGRCSAG